MVYLAVDNLFRDKNLLKGKYKNYSKAVFDHYYKLLDDGKVKEAYELSVKILSGFAVDEINSLVGEVIKFESENISTAEVWGRKIAKGIKPKEQVIELVDFLKNNGVEVWIVSSSSEILVRSAMKHFNIKADIIGIRNTVIKGKLTSKLEKPLPIIEGKVDCIKKFINSAKRPVIGAGDGINDLPMLEYCEIKVVVGLNNTLAKMAEQNRWFLI